MASSPPVDLAVDLGDQVHDGLRPAGPIARRLIYALVLIPIVPAISFIGLVAVGPNFISPWDDVRWLHLFFSTLWVVATVLIWRSVIVWTLGCKWLTALVGMIPFVQVVYGQPLWDAGCVSDDILRAGQHEFSIGLWVWLSIWVWWVWEKQQMAVDGKDIKDIPAEVRMTPIAKRIVASIGSIPAVVGLFWITVVSLEDLFSVRDPALAFTLMSVVAVAIWVIIWRRAVLWSDGVLWQTVVWAVGCLALPITLQWFFWRGTGNSIEVTLVCLPIIGWGVWMAVTVTIWPMQPAAAPRGDRIPQCLRCGYLLIGLRATRCPECGAEPTLDELWSAGEAGV